MNRRKVSVAISTSLCIATLFEGSTMASTAVLGEAVSKCIAYARSKGMSIDNAITDRYLDYPGEYFIRVFGSKGRNKNVAATCSWTSKFGGKLTYEDELDYMDH